MKKERRKWEGRDLEEVITWLLYQTVTKLCSFNLIKLKLKESLSKVLIELLNLVVISCLANRLIV